MARPTAPTGFAAVLAASRATSAGGLRGKRLWGVLALVWLPMIFLALGAIFAGDSASAGFEAFARTTSGVYLALLCPVVMVFLGTGAFSDEWSLGTAHYMVGSPLSRSAIVLGRWLTVVRQGLQLVLPPVLLSFFLSLVVHYSSAIPEYLDELVYVLLGLSLLMVTLGALFTLVGLLLKKPITGSLAYVFVFEIIGGNLPTSLMALSMNGHARNLLWHMTGHESFLGPMAQITTEVPTPWLTSFLWLFGTTAVCLAVAVWRLSARESGGTSAATSDDGAE